ncbi:MAG: glycosyltransferase family 4 protein [Planctomycetales bacterium]
MTETEPRVLLFAGRFELRGSSAYTVRLAERLQAHGVRSEIVCSDARRIEPERRERCPVRVYPNFDFPLWGRAILGAIRRDFSAAPPDLIHVQSWRVVSQGEWLAERLERPYVLTVHDYVPGGQRLKLDPRWCRRIIAVSDAVRAELLGRVPVADDRVRVIYSGVDPAVEAETLPVLEPGHIPVVGTAGPLEAVKGLPYLLLAAHKVLQTHRDVEFLIAGAGPEEANLRRIARELGIADNVTFAPNLQDFTPSLAAMDIFCLPSLRQGLGTIMLQAMALGKPVIATGVGGVYSVVRHEETGLVVQPSNAEELAERIVSLLDDPLKARAIAAAGRQLVRARFGVEKMVEQTAALYREVLAETPT